MKLKAFILSAILITQGFVKTSTADEGMWIPALLKKNYSRMQELGCNLSPEQIYAINNSSVKDAIVQLGNFCTAEVVSSKGLLLTNHHCAYDAIQEHSSVKHNYLKDGFWAKNHAAELHVPGLSVSFLVKIEEVTEGVVKAGEGKTGMEQAYAIQGKMSEIEESASQGGEYRAEVEPMFKNNRYFLFVYQSYDDIRLVGAPPSAVGKFGGDTDNWMWPRHTGDFSMLRIYADKENNPAEYSKENVPFSPKHHLPVSKKGIDKGDFTMIMGYPGSTDRYMTAAELKHTKETMNPMTINILKNRLDIMKAGMDADSAVYIQLASTYAALANYHKYLEGQTLGLNKFDLIGEKEELEEEFMAWVEKDETRTEKYGSCISNIETSLNTNKTALVVSRYLQMAGMAPSFVGNGMMLLRLKQMADEDEFEKSTAPVVQMLKGSLDESFKEYAPNVDQNMLASMLEIMHENLENDQLPDIFNTKLWKKKAKGDNITEQSKSFAEYLFKKSIIVDRERLEKFLDKPKMKTLEKDPGIRYVESIITAMRTRQQVTMEHNRTMKDGMQKFMAGMMEMQPKRPFYPDANFTMRLTYGQVKSYSSWDGDPYETFTWGYQILEKEKPNDPEFHVPKKLHDLLEAKDYGDYAVDGKLPVCFLHDLDITGGNSGSPVIDGDGNLVGIAFDGNWESMISDLYFMEEYVRTISVDIRYVLFIIDKFAGAKHLVDEMTIVGDAE